MIYLVLDTSTNGTVAAIFEDKKPLRLAYDADSSKQNEHLPLIVQEVMTKAGLGFSELDKILVTKGPGSFTGIRIGLAFARGLSLSMGTKVIGIDNFEALRGNCLTDNEVLTAIDSKKGDWFMKTPLSRAVAGGVETAKELIKNMNNPKIISYHSEKLGELLGIKSIFETKITAFGIVNAYLSRLERDINADISPNPLYIRPADVTLKK